MIKPRSPGCILFDWGDTLMRDIQEFSGPMKDWPRVELIPGAAETLSQLHSNWIMCLATNAEVSNESDIRLALERVSIARWLDRIYCYQVIGQRKPSPEFFLYILKDLGVAPERCVMVGDAFSIDIQGAVRCGLRAVWFNEFGHEIKTGSGIRTIHRLDELPLLLETWEGQ